MRHLNRSRTERGSMLVSVLFVVIVCGALASAVVMINLAAQREATTLLARERAFQLAEAGVDWAVAEMRKNGGALLPDPITTVNAHSTGDFVIRTLRGDSNLIDDDGDSFIDEADEASLATVLSTGRSGGMERTLQVTLREAIETPTVTGSMQFNVDFPIVDVRGNAFMIDGREHTLSGDLDTLKAALYGLSSPASVTYITDQLDPKRYDQIIGKDSNPSVGQADPIDLDAVVDQAKGMAAHIIPSGSAQTGLSLGTPTRSGVTVAYGEGDVHLSGGASGAGILAIDGDLRISGSFEWVGLVLVRGRVEFVGGGSSKRVIGALVVGEEITSNVSSASASVNGTIDLVYSSAAIDLAMRSVATMTVVSWQEVGNP